MKNLRQEKILELVKKYEIGTQEALIERLAKEGFEATQTTVSRDIRQLNLVKSTGASGAYRYVVREEAAARRSPAHTSSLSDAVVKIEAAENIVVIKTLAGMANAIAVCIEDRHIDGFVGSVAGDDTLLMVYKTREKGLDAELVLKKMFGH